ncbi:hypothetical protein [Sinorhizobium fredii]|uniref:hypothetical protein n=1 Tax=Rhizobium fredii TaxID=380 RepID=UPI00117D95D8|nr:hypothetical protein [Sinorhizobium fredii]
MIGKNVAVAALVACAVGGCTPQRTAQNIRQFQYEAASIQYDQIKMQLSRSIDNPYDVPTLTTVGTTQIKSGSGLSANLNRTLAPAGSTDQFGLTLGAITSASESAINTNTSPKAAQVMRDLYTYAVKGEINWGADVDANLVNMPPEYPWLYHSRSGTPPACREKDCAYLGRFGKYNLWAKSQKDYSDFVLSILEASSFQAASVVVSADDVKRPTSAKRPVDARRRPTRAPTVILRKPQLSPDTVIIAE